MKKEQGFITGKLESNEFDMVTGGELVIKKFGAQFATTPLLSLKTREQDMV